VIQEKRARGVRQDLRVRPGLPVQQVVPVQRGLPVQMGLPVQRGLLAQQVPLAQQVRQTLRSYEPIEEGVSPWIALRATEFDSSCRMRGRPTNWREPDGEARA
jgi:hypothetical protein